MNKFIVLFFLLIIASGLVFVNISQKQKAKTSIVKTIISVTKTPSSITPTPRLKNEDGWNIYNGWGVYTFAYPSDVSIEQAQDVVRALQKGPSQKDATEMSDGISLAFRLAKQEQGKTIQQSIESMVEKSKETGTITKPLTTIVIGDKQVYTYSVHGLGDGTYYFIQSNTRPGTFMIISDWTRDPAHIGFEQVVAKIISSFQFQ